MWYQTTAGRDSTTTMQSGEIKRTFGTPGRARDGDCNATFARERAPPAHNSSANVLRKVLERWYLHNPFPPVSVIEEIILETGLTAPQVKNWFAYRHNRDHSKNACKTMSLQELVDLPMGSIEATVMNLKELTPGRPLAFSPHGLKSRSEVDSATTEVANALQSLANVEGGLRSETAISDLLMFARAGTDDAVRSHILQMIDKTVDLKILQAISVSPIAHTIRAWFEEAVANDSALQLKLIEVVHCLPVSIDLLRSTKFGILVRKATSSKRKDVRRRAKQVYLKLRKQINKESNAITRGTVNGELLPNSVTASVISTAKELGPRDTVSWPDGLLLGAKRAVVSAHLASSGEAQGAMCPDVERPTSEAQHTAVFKEEPRSLSLDKAADMARHTGSDGLVKGDAELVDDSHAHTKLDMSGGKEVNQREGRGDGLLERKQFTEEETRKKLCSIIDQSLQFGHPTDSAALGIGMEVSSALSELTTPSTLSMSGVPAVHDEHLDVANNNSPPPLAFQCSFSCEIVSETPIRHRVTFDNLLDLVSPKLAPPASKKSEKGVDDVDVLDVAKVCTPKKGIMKPATGANSARGKHTVRFRPDHDLVEVHVVDVMIKEEEEMEVAEQASERMTASKNLFHEDCAWKLPPANWPAEIRSYRSKEMQIQQLRVKEVPEVIYPSREDIPPFPNEIDVEICDDMYVRKIPVGNDTKIHPKKIPSLNQGYVHNSHRLSNCKHEKARSATKSGFSSIVESYAPGQHEEPKAPAIKASWTRSPTAMDVIDSFQQETPIGLEPQGQSPGNFNLPSMLSSMSPNLQPSSLGLEGSTLDVWLRPSTKQSGSAAGGRDLWTLTTGCPPAAERSGLSARQSDPMPILAPSASDLQTMKPGSHDSLDNIFDMINSVGSCIPHRPARHQHLRPAVMQDETATSFQTSVLKYPITVTETSSILKRASEMLGSSSRPRMEGEPGTIHQFRFGFQKDPLSTMLPEKMYISQTQDITKRPKINLNLKQMSALAPVTERKGNFQQKRVPTPFQKAGSAKKKKCIRQEHLHTDLQIAEVQEKSISQLKWPPSPLAITGKREKMQPSPPNLTQVPLQGSEATGKKAGKSKRRWQGTGKARSRHFR